MEFRKIIRETRKIYEKGSFQTSLDDEGYGKPNIEEPNAGITWADGKNAVSEALKLLKDPKHGYYKPFSGRVETRVISFSNSLNITSHSQFHQFDTYEYSGGIQEVRIEIKVTFETVRTRKEAEKIRREKKYDHEDLYFIGRE